MKNIYLCLTSAFFSIAFTSCSTKQLNIGGPSGLVDDSASLHEVPVFVFSGRNLDEDERDEDPFGRRRARLRYPHLAVAEVMLQEDLTVDDLERKSNPAKKRRHASEALRDVELYPSESGVRLWQGKIKDDNYQAQPWINQIRQQFARSGSREILVYVHGFNTEFTENVVTAAEIFHLQGQEGAVISFGWPSVGKLVNYFEDKNHAQFSVRNFRSLISNIARETGATRVNIIAHSAGTPIVVNGMREIRLIEDEFTRAQFQEKYRLGRIVLAAPDMDLMNFLNGVLDDFQHVPERTAVYACSHDVALKLSSILYRVRRLGRAPDTLEDWESDLLEQEKTVELIDVSLAEHRDGHWINHNYFYSNPAVAADIDNFIDGSNAVERGLVREPGDIFWTLPND